MKSRLLKDIKTAYEYNAGGLTNIFLLNIDYFQGYEFRGDNLYDESYVERIFKVAPFVEIAIENESKFSETINNGVYKQELETYVRAIDGELIQWMLRARMNKYLVIFRTRFGRYFVFGSDGGANLSHSGQTGQVADVNGMSLKLEKSSVYPHFEVAATAMTEHVSHSEFVPQFDNAYCTTFDYLPQFDSFYCITK